MHALAATGHVTANLGQVAADAPDADGPPARGSFQMHLSVPVRALVGLL